MTCVSSMRAVCGLKVGQLDIYMDVSRNRGTSTSSILIGVSIINYPFWGTPIFGNTYIYILWFSSSNFHASCLVFGQNWPCHRGFIPNLRFQLGSAFKHLLSFSPQRFWEEDDPNLTGAWFFIQTAEASEENPPTSRHLLACSKCLLRFSTI